MIYNNELIATSPQQLLPASPSEKHFFHLSHIGPDGPGNIDLEGLIREHASHQDLSDQAPPRPEDWERDEQSVDTYVDTTPLEEPLPETDSGRTEMEVEEELLAPPQQVPPEAPFREPRTPSTLAPDSPQEATPAEPQPGDGPEGQPTEAPEPQPQGHPVQRQVAEPSPRAVGSRVQHGGSSSSATPTARRIFMEDDVPHSVKRRNLD